MQSVVPRTSSLAVVGFIFAILAYVCLPFVGALVAINCGHSARAEIRRAPPGALDGDGLALAGLILGWIQVAMGLVVLVFIALTVAGAIAFSGFH
jgi:hypothetical protein